MVVFVLLLLGVSVGDFRASSEASVLVFLFLVLDLGLILVPTRRRFCLVGVIVVLFLSVVLDGAVLAVASCIKYDVRAAAAAGAAASSSVVFAVGSILRDCGAVCAIVVIFVVFLINLDVLALLASSCAVDCGGGAVGVVFIGMLTILISRRRVGMLRLVLIL